MKKILLITFTIISLCNLLYSQESDNSGKPIAEIFSNFHYSFDNDTTTGFGINRAYIGYNYLCSHNLSAKILLNFGQSDDLPEDATSKHYAYFREASFKYSFDKLNLIFGITPTQFYTTQQRFWGKRYIYESIERRHDFGYNADIGIAIEYRPRETINCDFSFTNGEGYSNLQLDNTFKTTGGITIIPWKQMTFRLYGDIMIPGKIIQSTLLCFAGFKNELITLGAEVIYQTNHELIEDHNLWGFSGTGSIAILKNTELFARYDYSSSSKIPGDPSQWHYKDDDIFLVNGIQYTFNNYLRMALSYQKTIHPNAGENKRELIYLSTRFCF